MGFRHGEPVGFAEHTLAANTLNGNAQLFSCNEGHCGEVLTLKGDIKRARPIFFALFEEGVNGLALFDATMTGEGKRRFYAETRARPFARLALMTRRPPTVLIRTRNPWVFFRFL